MFHPSAFGNQLEVSASGAESDAGQLTFRLFVDRKFVNF